MRRLSVIFALFATLLFVGCDDPVVTFYEYQGEYTLDGNRKLDVVVNSVTLTDTESGVEVKFDDNNIATLVLKQVIPGMGELTIGGVQVTPAPDGNGIVFAGQMALDETKKVVFQGGIINNHLTLQIDIVPLVPTVTPGTNPA